jgi:diguanylate cyclase (GGDEF)-like protein
VLNQLQANSLSESAGAIEKAQFYATLSQAYYDLTYAQKSLEFAQLSITFANQNKQPWLYHTLKIFESLAFEMQGQYSLGLAGVKEAISWAESNDNQQVLALGFYAQGVISTGLSQYFLALNEFQQAYALSSDDKGIITSSDVAGMLAQVYQYRREDILAIPLFEEAQSAFRKREAWAQLRIVMFRLGMANYNIGKVELARAQLAESMQLAEKTDDTQGVADTLKELASINIEQKNYIDAKQQLLEAKQIYSLANTSQSNFDVTRTLSTLALRQGKLVDALRYLNDAQELLDRENMPVQGMNFDELNAHILYKQNNPEQAYDLLKSVHQSYKEYSNVQSTEQLDKLRVEYNIQDSKQKNQVLKQENILQQYELKNQKDNLLIGLLIAILAAGLVGLLWALAYKSKIHRETLEKLASIDQLTGLFNRRQTLERLNNKLALTSRYDFDLCVAVVGLDWFKQVNDRFGHFTGDKVLRLFSALCKDNLRETDIIGRVGGDEFLILLSHTDAKSAFQVMDNLRLKMADLTTEINMPKLSLTISVGLCECQKDDTSETLSQFADIALYRAKNNGRDQVVVCDRRDEPQNK